MHEENRIGARIGHCRAAPVEEVDPLAGHDLDEEALGLGPAGSCVHPT